MTIPAHSLGRRKSSTVLILLLAIGGMTGLVAASVPLYRLFCQVTGYGGTTRTADEISGPVLDREVEVRFNADVAGGMPWDFRPVERSTRIKVGEQALAYFHARNPTDREIVGTATYNVTPQKAGLYFTKIECFCFTEQRLAPGAEVDMPVTFFVDPAIDEDPNLDDVGTITLSYTFFEKRGESGRDAGALTRLIAGE